MASVDTRCRYPWVLFVKNFFTNCFNIPSSNYKGLLPSYSSLTRWEWWSLLFHTSYPYLHPCPHPLFFLVVHPSSLSSYPSVISLPRMVSRLRTSRSIVYVLNPKSGPSTPLYHPFYQEITQDPNLLFSRPVIRGRLDQKNIKMNDFNRRTESSGGRSTLG